MTLEAGGVIADVRDHIQKARDRISARAEPVVA
jgi:hypothetical protein